MERKIKMQSDGNRKGEQKGCMGTRCDRETGREREGKGREMRETRHRERGTAELEERKGRIG